MIRDQVEKAIAGPMGGFLLRALKPLSPRRPNELQVLTYHTVDDVAGFRAQMRYLATHYAPVAVEDVVDAFSARRTLPKRAVLITFDDAYRDFAESAWPIMRCLGLPVTLFVPTDFPDRPERVFWWDCLAHALATTRLRDPLQSPLGELSIATSAERRAALKRLKQHLRKLPPTEAQAWSYELSGRLGVGAPESRVLGWDRLRQLKKEGVTLAPHSRSHPLLGRLPRRESREEIVGSLVDLQRHTGPVLPIFAYPGGSYNEETVTILTRADFLLAFTTAWGTNKVMHTPRFEVKRINIRGDLSAGGLEARLLYGSNLLTSWHAYRTKKRS